MADLAAKGPGLATDNTFTRYGRSPSPSIYNTVFLSFATHKPTVSRMKCFRQCARLRWVIYKEKHADSIIEEVGYYFMSQRFPKWEFSSNEVCCHNSRPCVRSKHGDHETMA